MAISYRNSQSLMTSHPEIAEAFDDVINHIQGVMTQTNASPAGQADPPITPSSLNVTAAHGIFDASITDNNQARRGINYFLEYSTTPAFNAPHTIDLRQSRNHRVALGNQTLYWRAHSSYPTGPRSNPVYHGGQLNPLPVNGGGAFTGPVIQNSQGSGTSYGPSGSDGAFGNNAMRKTA